MVGFQRVPAGSIGVSAAGFVEGAAELTYDFSANEVDLDITDISAAEVDSPLGGRYTPVYKGPKSLGWANLPVNSDGSFYIRGHGNDKAGTDLHPELGYVDGDFYGPGGEEFAGVFESAPYAVDSTPGFSLVGAFGGRRQPDE